MTSFVVLQQGEDRTRRSTENIVFVSDAFSIMALAFPVLWLFWYRLWLTGIAALLAFILVSVLAVHNPALAWLPLTYSAFLSLLVALEGSVWRISAFQARGYDYRGVVDADSLEEAQLSWALRPDKQEETEAPEASVKITVRPQFDNDDLIFNAGGNS